MNDEDVFAELVLHPLARVGVRADYHWLRLTEPRDLWYAGGGATNDRVFGFSGTPSGGRRELAHLIDIGVDVKINEWIAVYLYYAHAFGQGVVASTFAGTDASYGYVEVTARY